MGFNQKWAQSHSKAEFIEQHKHHENDFDLGAEWEALQEKPKATEEKTDVEFEVLPPADNTEKVNKPKK